MSHPHWLNLQQPRERRVGDFATSRSQARFMVTAITKIVLLALFWSVELPPNKPTVFNAHPLRCIRFPPNLGQGKKISCFCREFDNADCFDLNPWAIVMREEWTKKKRWTIQNPSASVNHACAVLAASVRYGPTFFLSLVMFRKSIEYDVGYRTYLVTASIASLFVVFILLGQVIFIARCVGNEIQSTKKSFGSRMRWPCV